MPRFKRLGRSTCRPTARPYCRRLHIESLEDRRLLALFTVTTNQDNVDPDDNLLSLREAIAEANLSEGPDELDFDFGHDGPEVILLTQGELTITDALTINGPGHELLTIDAQKQSRIFNITATEGDFHLAGLTLTGGRTTGNNSDFMDSTYSGGAIRSLTSDELTLTRTTIVGNSTEGSFAKGGGVFAIAVTLYESRIKNNFTSEFGSDGGGIRAASLTLHQSSVTGNSTAGTQAWGGGIYGDVVSLHESEVSGNSTSGNFGRGGGISTKVALALHQSVVSGNNTVGHNSHGGGIYARGYLTLSNSAVTANSTLGSLSPGGGVYGNQDVTLYNTTVSRNSTAGNDSNGGGISGQTQVILHNSVVTRNSTAGENSDGAGVASRNITLTHSTVTGNRTLGDMADGGGIFAGGSLSMTQSTVSGNYTLGDMAVGGGVFVGGSVSLDQSTVSGNRTAGMSSHGGGIRTISHFFAVTIAESTVTDNHATHTTSIGGGLSQLNIHSEQALSISGSILAGNTAGGGEADVSPRSDANLIVNHSLIGVANDLPITGTGNLTGTAENPLDPLLGPLADHGGPTRTHALLPGSPAIDTGDPTIEFDENEFDQRGHGYRRVVDGTGINDPRIDIGAYEAQGIPVGYPLGDYNRDGAANVADYVVWRNTEGQEVEPFSGADGDGSGVIDAVDLVFWRQHFGNTEIQLSIGAGSGASHREDRNAEMVAAELGVPPGESASAAVGPTKSHHPPLSPKVHDTALLLVLTASAELNRSVDPAFTRPEDYSSELERDDFFAQLAPQHLSLFESVNPNRFRG